MSIETQTTSSLSELAAQIGGELCQQREVRNLSRRDIATPLKLTTYIIERIESGRIEGLAAPVYMKGYLKHYGAMVGVDCSPLIAVIEQQDQQAPLPTAIPMKKPLLDRYLKLGTVAAATVMVVGPLLWWANHHYRTLPFVTDSNSVHSGTTSDMDGEVTVQTAPVLQASMAPLIESSQSSQPEDSNTSSVVDTVFDGALEEEELQAQPDDILPQSKSETSAEDSDTTPTDSLLANNNVLELLLEEPAWVEITDQSGVRLEYDLLQPAVAHEYSFAQSAHLKIGNAEHARLWLNGDAVDLAAYTRGEVANITLGEQD